MAKRDYHEPLIFASISPSVRETVAAVYELNGSGEMGLSLKPIAQALGVDKSTASRRVKIAIALGYIKNEEFKPGVEMRVVLDQPMPDDEDVLPSPETLEDALKK